MGSNGVWPSKSYVVNPFSPGIYGYMQSSGLSVLRLRSSLSRHMSNCPFGCKRRCMRCVGPLTELQNLIIYVTSKEWERRVMKYLTQPPERGHKMLIHYHGERILCRIVEV